MAAKAREALPTSPEVRAGKAAWDTELALGSLQGWADTGSATAPGGVSLKWGPAGLKPTEDHMIPFGTSEGPSGSNFQDGVSGKEEEPVASPCREGSGRADYHKEEVQSCQ